MFEQTRDLSTSPAVRDGQITVVTCGACGCRLRPDLSNAGASTWGHFGALGGRDARGHRTPCVELPHDALGRSAVPA